MRRIPLATWAAVAGCCVLWISLGSRIAPGARNHDFLNLYTGASLALEGNFAHMHSPEVQLDRERRFVPGLDALVPFVRPPFYALILAPLALLPFGVAFWVWIGLQSVLLLGCWAWAFRRWGPDALIFGAFYLPTALGIASGQDCVEMLVIAIAIYTFAAKNKHWASGAALGLGLIKFHLFLLWPLALVIQKRWRMLFGAIAAVAAELLVSLWLAGPSGLVSYFQLLQRKDIQHLSPSPDLMINVHSLALNVGAGSLWIRALLVLIVIALVSAACWRAPLWRWIAAASAGSLLVAPHVYGYDAGLLLLSLWLTIFVCVQTSTRLAATLLITPIPFLMTLASRPWAATTPLVLLLFLVALNRKTGALSSGSEPLPDVGREVPSLAEAHPLV
ncbi:MAG TPA: glycosyltransferase family 87 protein [Bryobacteraceae bacterium]|nr:glycosyltransferase family 87 protein [Bryobacteraceae bacterium]